MSGVAFAPAVDKYRLSYAGPTSVDSPLPGIAGAAPGDNTQMTPWHPHSPLFAFGVLAALTFGLMAASASVRIGKTTAGVNVGTT